MEEWGGLHPAACTYRVHQWEKGGTLTRQRSPTVCSQGTEGGFPPEQQHAILAQGLKEREEGDPLTKRGRGGHPPINNVRPPCKACWREGEGTPQIIRGPPLQDKVGLGGNKGTVDRTVKRRRYTASIRGEGDARGGGMSHRGAHS